MAEKKKKEEAVAERQEPISLTNVFGSIAAFEGAARIGMMLSKTSLVPETYRGEGNVGNCVIALEMANRIGANVISVMQNMYIVHGRPAWSSQFLISCVNASRKFTPLRYAMQGEEGTDSWGCRAWAIDKSGEKLESPLVTIGMAKAEGWYNRKGSKWLTLPELMMRYRSATFFTRLYAPELTMGIMTDDEVNDINPATTLPKLIPVGAAAPIDLTEGADPDLSAKEPDEKPAKPPKKKPAKNAPPEGVDPERVSIIEEIESRANGAPRTANHCFDEVGIDRKEMQTAPTPALADVLKLMREQDGR